MLFFFFFFNDTATTEIYTLSLHDALPISDAGNPLTLHGASVFMELEAMQASGLTPRDVRPEADRKSTRLNSSHVRISYAVFCLKKKKNDITTTSYATSASVSTANNTTQPE